MSFTIVDVPPERPEFLRETIRLLAEKLDRDRARLLERVARASDAELTAGNDAEWGIGQIAVHLDRKSVV